MKNRKILDFLHGMLNAMQEVTVHRNIRRIAQIADDVVYEFLI